MDELMICDRMMFWFQVLYGFDCLFYVYKCIGKLWGQIWGQGDQNWGFGVEIVDSRKGRHKNRVVVLCNSRHGDKWRARRDSQKQQTPFLLFRALGDQSGLSKMFLLTCLISVYTFKPTGTSYGLNWTWFCELNLTFEKCPRTPIFPKLVFLKRMK